MSLALKIFTAFEEQGSKVIDLLRKRAFTPNLTKTLRTWGITDACKMIGRSVQTVRDLEKEGKIPLPILDPDTNRRLYTLEHINKLRDYFGTRPGKPKGAKAIVIAVTNFKGGVWKTTTGTDNSQGFALKGYKVLVVDGDSQGSATQSFGYIPDSDIDSDDTLLPYLRGDITDIRQVIRKTYWDGLDLIPANLALYNAEFELPVKNAQLRSQGKSFDFHSILRQGLESVRDDYDIIIIDCPPSMGMISINAIFAADGLLIPMPPAMLDFTSTVQFFGMVKDVLERLPAKEYDFIKLLITKFDSSSHTKVLVDNIKEVYGSYVLDTKMPISEAIKKAGTDMCSIYEVENYPGSKKTLDRILMEADKANSEIEDLVIQAWANSIAVQPNNSVELEAIAND